MSEAAPQSPLIDMLEKSAAYRRDVADMLSRPGNSVAEKNHREAAETEPRSGN